MPYWSLLMHGEFANPIKGAQPFVHGVLLCLLEGSVYVDDHQGGHVRPSKLDGQTRPFSTGVVSEYCDILVHTLMDEEHSS